MSANTILVIVGAVLVVVGLAKAGQSGGGGPPSRAERTGLPGCNRKRKPVLCLPVRLWRSVMRLPRSIDLKRVWGCSHPQNQSGVGHTPVRLETRCATSAEWRV